MKRLPFSQVKSALPIAALLALVTGGLACSTATTGDGANTDATGFEPVGTTPTVMPASPYSPTAPHYNDLAFADEAEIPFDPHVKHGQLANGLRWFLRPNTEPENRAELRLVVNAGSLLEEEDQRGLAHFLEHMAFNGTEHFEKQALIDYLESVGMKFGPEINAYTSFDETVYMLTIPTDSTEIVETAFEVLADWSRRMLLDPEEVTKERGVVLEEWRLRQGAGQRMSDETLPVLFHGSRYAERLPIGKPEVIEGATPELLRRYYENWYRPDLMAVIAVGDFEIAPMLDLIQKNFGEQWGPSDPASRTVFDIPEHDVTLVKIVTDPETTSSSVRVTVKKPRERAETVGDFRRGALESLYTQMFNGRLREKLQKEDPPYLGAFAGASEMGRTRDTLVLGAGAEDGGVLRALETVLLEAKRVRRDGFTATEFERARTQLDRAVRKQYDERENTPSRSYAGGLVGHFLDGADMPGVEFRYELFGQMLPTLRLEEVNALERDFLQEANRVITVTGPEKDDAGIPTEAELLAVFESVELAEVEPYVDDVNDDPLFPQLPGRGAVVETVEHTELGITEWTLSNGVRVLAKPTDFKSDELQMSAYSWGGRSLGPASRNISLSFASFLVNMGGLGQFDAVQLEKLLAGKQVGVNPYIGTLEEGFGGSASPEDLETLLQLTNLYFTAPRRDEEAFRSLQQRFSAMLRNKDMNPGSAYSDTLSVTLQNYHPWSLPLRSEEIDTMDLDAAIDFYRERFADASDFVFFFVGNLDLATLRDRVELYLGSLPALHRGEMWADPGVRPPAGPVHKVVRAGMAEKAQTTLFWEFPLREWSRKERHTLSSLGQALNTRLREVIREDLSGSYGVRVSMGGRKEPYERVNLRISFGCDPERLDELVGEVYDVLDAVRDKGLEASYLEKVKESQRRDLEEGLESNDYWISSMEIRDKMGVPQNEMLETEAVIDALGIDALNGAATHYLGGLPTVRVDWMPGEDG